MKTNFTLYLLLLVLTLNTLSTKSQTVFEYNFNATPALISGTANEINAIYRFAEVSAGGDAIVTIVPAIKGASVDIVDDNTITRPERFSLKIKVPAHKAGLMEFQVCFINAGTMTSMLQDSLFASAIDVDGRAYGITKTPMVHFNAITEGNVEIRIISISEQAALSTRSVVGKNSNNAVVPGLDKLNDGIYGATYNRRNNNRKSENHQKLIAG